MLEHGKIASRQFTFLATLYMIGSSILISPSILASEANQDAWIAAALTVACGLLVLPLYVALGSRFPSMTFAEYSEKLLGKWLGKTVSLLFLAGLPFMIATLTLRNIGDFLTTQVIPETPIQAIHIMIIAVVIMGVRLGLEPLARAAELFFPWIVLLFIILVFCVAPQIKFENILPVLEKGLKPVMKGIIPFLSFPFLEPVIFLMLFPYVNRKEKVGKALFQAVLIGGIMLSIITLLAILVLGADFTARNMFPSYMLAKKINIGRFLTRIEVIVAVIWFITIYFRLSILLYVTALGIAQSLNVKDYRFLTFPLGMILIVLSLLTVPNSSYLIEFNRLIWPVYVPTFGLVLPLLLLGTAIFRNKRAQETADPNDPS